MTLLKKITQYGLFIVSGVIILGIIVLAAMYIRGTLAGDVTVDTSGRVTTDFRVFYVENELFEPEHIPRSLAFLMFFTDYIEFEPSFIANFGRDDVDIYYEYVATKNFVIRYMSTLDANMNPIVFEESWVLSESQGQTTGNSLRFNASNGNNAGVYTLHPWPHIWEYINFVHVHNSRIDEFGDVSLDMRGFSAELFVDFAYSVRVPSLQLDQTIRQGYRLSISTGVYNLVTTGNSAFNETINLTMQNLPFELNFPVMVMFALALALSAYCLFRGIRQLQAHSNERKQRVADIQKRYYNEIVTNEHPLDLSEFRLTHVSEFEELLKLAVNLNRHIMCYEGDEYAEFATVIEPYAYYLKILFTTPDDNDDNEASAHVIEADSEAKDLEPVE